MMFNKKIQEHKAIVVNYSQRILDHLDEIVKEKPVDVIVPVGTNDHSNNVNQLSRNIVTQSHGNHFP